MSRLARHTFGVSFRATEALATAPDAFCTIVSICKDDQIWPQVANFVVGLLTRFVITACSAIEAGLLSSSTGTTRR